MSDAKDVADRIDRSDYGVDPNGRIVCEMRCYAPDVLALLTVISSHEIGEISIPKSQFTAFLELSLNSQ